VATWEAIENAIFAWVRDASGLSASQIVWSEQISDINKPTGQHVRISLGQDTQLGAHPEVTHEYDSGASAGAEITITAESISEFPVTVQVLGGSTVQNSSARAIASTIRNKLALTTTKDAFAAVGISCFDLGRVQSLPAILASNYEARAFFEARFYVLQSVSETNTYISSTEIENLDTGDLFTVELDE
jgi:hypothetical protein